MIVKSNAIGIPLLAVIQGIVAVIGYFIFQTPDPLLFGFLTCIATIIPIVGTALVWVPLAGLYGFKTEIGYMPWDWLFYALLVITNVDNLIRFILQKKLADIHPLITRLRSRNRVVLIRIYGDHLRAVVIILIPSLYRYLQEELFG